MLRTIAHSRKAWVISANMGSMLRDLGFPGTQEELAHYVAGTSPATPFWRRWFG